MTILYKQKSENGIFLLNQAVFGNSLQAENSKMGSHFSENVLYGPCKSPSEERRVTVDEEL